MITEERQQIILDELNKKPIIYVSDLVEKLNTSESTIRRDLNSLDKQGKLKKVHGGATKLKENIHVKDDEINIRKNLNIEEKIEIAKKAAQLIETNDFVYIDSGTTTELMIDYISEEKAVYVTNGINQAKKLVNRGFVTYILAGELKSSTEAIVGVEAINCLRKYNFTKGFFGANGVSENRGYTTPEIKEALVKEEALKRSRSAYVLVDDSKFNDISCITFANLEDACVITSNVKNNYKDTIKELTKVVEVTVE